MRRTAGTVERALELVGAAITWGLDATVTVQPSAKGGRPSYVVTTSEGPENEPEPPIRPDPTMVST